MGTKDNYGSISFISDSKLENGLKKSKSDEPADFETAISATGFGKFNFILLLLVGIPSGWASMFETTTMSYILPVAHCDLEMNMAQKGLLNGITYLGMVTSAMLWGFLADTLGRRKLLVFGYLLDAVFVFIAGISQNFAMIAAAKFFGGFIINGPFAVFTATLSEFHCAKYRAKVVLLMGIAFSLAQIYLPLIAWVILPYREMEFSIFENTFQIHTWNIFILLSGLPSLISSVCHYFLPESPKFLMTCGENEKALKVFQLVYSMNSGKPKNTFPIKKLVDETTLHEGDPKFCQITAHRSKMQALREGWQQIRPLFKTPHVLPMALVATIQLGSMMGLNTLRLWLPQIFTAMNDYAKLSDDTPASLCTMLSVLQPNSTVSEEETICQVNYNNESVYINSLIVSFTQIIGYLCATGAINKLGKKNIIMIFGSVGGLSGISLYFAKNSETTIALSSIFTAMGAINSNVILTVVVDLFPTTLRTMTVSITMMVGRSGALLGNVLFPYLIDSGCLPPFLFIGMSTIFCASLSTLLPKTDQKALE